MAAVQVLAALAICFNAVVSIKLYGSGQCASTYFSNSVASTNYYSTTLCKLENIPDAVKDKISLITTSKGCPKGSYDLETIGDDLYVKVTDGCDGIFTIYSSEIKSPVGGSGTWASWSDWTTCNYDCKKNRSRTCSTGKDTDCSGASTSELPCYAGECHYLSATWGSWSSWGYCASTCKQRRTRYCSSLVQTCTGSKEDFRDCTGEYCTGAPTWGSWSSWSYCNSACTQTRSRSCGSMTQTCSGSSQTTQACTGGYCSGGGGTAKKIVGLNHDSCGKANTPGGFRIINGRQAAECEYPWMVFLYNGGAGTTCGASIINERYLLTAAHCVTDNRNRLYDASHFRFYAGTSTRPRSRPASHYAEKVIVHPTYLWDGYNIRDDIAVIKLTTPIKFDRCHRPICISDGTPNVQNAENCRSMGWGTTTNYYPTAPSVLQWTVERPISDSRCNLYYSGRVTHKNFCALGENSGICSGDSGGPFACKSDTDGKYYQYGLVSLGKKNKCGSAQALYIHVPAYLDWIEKSIKY